jgi:hypothetical protein
MSFEEARWPIGSTRRSTCSKIRYNSRSDTGGDHARPSLPADIAGQMRDSSSGTPHGGEARGRVRPAAFAKGVRDGGGEDGALEQLALPQITGACDDGLALPRQLTPVRPEGRLGGLQSRSDRVGGRRRARGVGDRVGDESTQRVLAPEQHLRLVREVTEEDG